MANPTSLAEFLDWEKDQPHRWEFINGTAYAMAGGTLASNRLAKNISRAVDGVLAGRGCESFIENVKVLTATDCLYPDVLIACGPLGNDATEVSNPVVIFEVLSKGTAKYDSSAKFLKYQTIPSLQHYVLVSQDAMAVQNFSRRADGQWADYHAISGGGEVLVLGALGITIRLAEIYAGVLVDAPPA